MTATVLCRSAGSDAWQGEGQDEDIKPVEIDYSESDEAVKYTISPHEGEFFKVEVRNKYSVFKSNLFCICALPGKCIAESCPD